MSDENLGDVFQAFSVPHLQMQIAALREEIKDLRAELAAKKERKRWKVGDECWILSELEAPYIDRAHVSRFDHDDLSVEVKIDVTCSPEITLWRGIENLYPTRAEAEEVLEYRRSFGGEE